MASTSQEGERNLLLVTLLSSEWRSSTDRDLSTLIRELAIQLAKHPSVQVSVFLPRCSDDDKKVASSHKVQLIEAEEMPGFDPVDWLINTPEDHAMDCIIGHGVHLGRQIPCIRRNHQCRWIQIVHTIHEELAMHQSNTDAIPRGEQMQQTEIKLCELADQVVAVGPKVAEAYRRFLRSSEKHQDVIDLTPSIFTEFLDVKQAPEERETFCVLVIESGDSEDFNLKGYDLAAQAIAKLTEKCYQLRFVSSRRGKGDEIAEKLLKHGIDRSQLIVRSFNESRETLAKLFCEVDLAIMPSRSEGFGLTALEALSAGLPVLVSSNSGLGQALMKVPYGPNCVVNSEDPKDWARKIKVVCKRNRDVRLAESKLLRDKYLEKYSWQEPCGALVEKMWNLVTDLKLETDVESMERAEQNTRDRTASLNKPGGPQNGSLASRSIAENMAIPLCLPNNCQWSAATGELIKTGERRSSLYVVDEALQKLRTVRGPVCVVSIAGDCKTGKSYILSEAFGQSDVFPLAHDWDHGTMGIWMWVVPQKIRDSNGQDCTVVLLDSEGMNAMSGEIFDDNQIFTLNVLLASVLIYNSTRIPPMRDLEGMYFVAKLSHWIKAHTSNGGGSMRGRQEDTEFFHKIFPVFIWLLRDVTQSLPLDCKDIKEYFLTKVFRDKGSSRLDHNQEVAESFLRFSPGFHAFELPSPTIDEEVLKSINLNKSQINPVFLSGIKEFKELLRTTLIPKHIFNDGEIVTGEGRAYVV